MFCAVSARYWGQGGQGGQGDDHWGKKGGGKTKVKLFTPADLKHGKREKEQQEEIADIASLTSRLKTIISPYVLSLKTEI